MAKVKLVGLALKNQLEGSPAFFKVGEPLTQEGQPVSSITYLKTGYSNGNFGMFPCYKVDFENVPARYIVREDDVSQFIVLVEEESKVEGDLPDRPEDQS